MTAETKLVETPRTDAFVASIAFRAEADYGCVQLAVAHARTLERELNEPACTDGKGTWHNPDDLSKLAAMTAERDAAVAHVARITGKQDWWKDPWVPVRIADLDALRKDAARYRWLRSPARTNKWQVSRRRQDEAYVWYTVDSAEYLDAAIDAALQSEKGEGG